MSPSPETSDISPEIEVVTLPYIAKKKKLEKYGEKNLWTLLGVSPQAKDEAKKKAKISQKSIGMYVNDIILGKEGNRIDKLPLDSLIDKLRAIQNLTEIMTCDTQIIGNFIRETHTQIKINNVLSILILSIFIIILILGSFFVLKN